MQAESRVTPRRADATPVGTQEFFVLSGAEVSRAVRRTSPGNYALGYFDGSSFTAFYVGRSDSDLGASLLAWVDVPSRPRRRSAAPRNPWSSTRRGLPSLGTRTLGHITVGEDSSYTHFAFCYAASAAAAFDRECQDYHELGGSEGLDNPRHPEPPDDTPWTCPIAGAPT